MLGISLDSMDAAENDTDERFMSYGETEEDNDESDEDFSLDSSPTATEQGRTPAQAPRSGKKRGPGAISKQYSKQQHIQAQLTDTQLAAELAEAVGLPPHRLGEHEQGGLSEDETSKHDDMYFQVCCAQLALRHWRHTRQFCRRATRNASFLTRLPCCSPLCLTACLPACLSCVLPCTCACLPACLCTGPQLHSCPVAVGCDTVSQ